MSRDSTKPKVFICHAPEDVEIGGEIRDRIKEAVLNTPILLGDILSTNQDWKSIITNSVRESRVLIICLTQHSVKKKEIEYAIELALEIPRTKLHILPIRFDDCPYPRELSSIHYVLYDRENSEDAFWRIISNLDTVARLDTYYKK